MLIHPDTLPLEALRRRAWWRAVRRYDLTPAEISLLVISGNRDRDRRRPDETDDTSTAMDP